MCSAIAVKYLLLVAAVFGNAETARLLGDGAGGERGGVGGGAGIVGHWKEVRESHTAPGNVAPSMPAASKKKNNKRKTTNKSGDLTVNYPGSPQEGSRVPQTALCWGLDHNNKAHRVHGAMFVSPGGNAVRR